MPHHFRPSDLLLVGDVPLPGCFGARALDQAGGLLVAILQRSGDDAFRAISHAELCAFFDVMIAAPELVPPWLLDDRFDPDWEGLARAGFMVWVGRDPPKGMQFSDAGIARLRRCAFNRAAQRQAAGR